MTDPVGVEQEAEAVAAEGQVGEDRLQGRRSPGAGVPLGGLLREGEGEGDVGGADAGPVGRRAGRGPTSRAAQWGTITLAVASNFALAKPSGAVEEETQLGFRKWLADRQRTRLRVSEEE